MMRPTTQTVRSVLIPLGAGVLLRVVHESDADLGDRLVFLRGFGAEGEPFRRPHWAGEPLVVPASILPQLRQALEALDVGS